MKVTLEVPDELAENLPKGRKEMTAVVLRGLQHRHRRLLNQIAGWNDVLDVLSSLPTPEEVLALRPTPARSRRIRSLLAKLKDEGLSPAEREEMDACMEVEHVVSLAKARALAKLHGQRAAA